VTVLLDPSWHERVTATAWDEALLRTRAAERPPVRGLWQGEAGIVLVGDLRPSAGRPGLQLDCVHRNVDW
jgi:hypothetical protein